MALYRLDEVVSATGGRGEGLGSDPVTAVSIDSREIGSGALFVAIEGERFDGHDFVPGAIEAGAVAALVSTARAHEFSGLPLIIVQDPLEALNALARFNRARSNARIVAVTGSVGKTSTKDALGAIFSSAGRAHAAIRSFNNHWGVPLTLARMPVDTERAVFEIGMNHAGEITPLVKLVRPHVAVITAIAEAHLELLGSLEAIADAKGEIFSGLEPGGTAIVNIDHDHGPRLVAHAQAAGAHVMTFGFADTAQVQVRAIEGETSGIAGHLEGEGLSLDLSLPDPGRHRLSNAAAAVLAARACGVDPREAAATLAALGAGAGRGAMSRLGPAEAPLVLIDESYNANPASMRAALAALPEPDGRGYRVLILGDMLELGANAPTLHSELSPAVAASHADRVFLVGPHMRALAEVLPRSLVCGHGDRVEDIADDIVGSLAYGDTVMVKGSNGVRLGGLVNAIRHKFDTALRSEPLT